MYDFSLGNGDAPSLLCSGRATSMLTMLHDLGIDSRLIFLYADAQGSIAEHTMLEVLNPDTQNWELHDPLTDYYVGDEHGERVSIERAVFGSVDDLQQCRADDCSHEGIQHLLPYFAAFRYGYVNEIWINPDRFDISKRFADENDMNLAEYLTNGNPRSFTFFLDTEKPDAAD